MSVQLKEPTPPTVQQAPPAVKNYRPDNAYDGMSGLLASRHLTWVMVRRDLLGRYKGSLMGFFWTIINPLGHMLLYIFVFSVILKVRFGASTGTGNFALYLMAGLLPWGALSETLLRVTGCVAEQPNLVKRVVFPLEVLPLAVCVSSMLSELIGLTVLCGAVAIFGGGIKPTVLYLPLILASQFLFIAGASWFLGSLGVYLQDLRHMMSLALSTWMYATPIVYPSSCFPAQLHALLWLNPIAGMVNDYRRVLLEGQPPDWPMFAAYTSVAIVTWFAGYYFFTKTKRSFADVV